MVCDVDFLLEFAVNLITLISKHLDTLHIRHLSFHLFYPLLTFLLGARGASVKDVKKMVEKVWAFKMSYVLVSTFLHQLQTL